MFDIQFSHGGLALLSGSCWPPDRSEMCSLAIYILGDFEGKKWHYLFFLCLIEFPLNQSGPWLFFAGSFSIVSAMSLLVISIQLCWFF